MAVLPKKNTDKPFLVIITGLSGAGLTTAGNALQDHGFFCIDNLPFELLWEAVALVKSGKYQARGFVFVMDIRNKRFAAEFPALKEKLSEDVRLDIVFLTADPSVLAVRYGSTRRKHPLLSASGNLLQAIRKESELLAPLEKAADVVIDTSEWSPTILARALEERLHQDLPSRILYVTISSFGFKYGQLRPADLLFDVRFLSNPHFVSELKEKTGMSADVRKYVLADATAKEFFTKLEDMVRFMLPHYYSEGKHYLRIGIGCTGGKHRSVTIAEELAKSLSKKSIANIAVSIVHRDIELA